MSWGIKVYDAEGKTVLDGVKKTCRLVVMGTLSFSLPSGNNSQSSTVNYGTTLPELPQVVIMPSRIDVGISVTAYTDKFTVTVTGYGPVSLTIDYAVMRMA